MQQFEIESSRGARSLRAGLAACGALVLFLSSIGLYGAVALGVRQRRREIGVRMALGARAEQVIALFYSEGLRLGILGLLLGLPISVTAAYLVDRQPTGNAAPSHALVGMLIAVVVLVVASIATLIPAAHAARVNPVISLRSE
jgi:ABC-type antimicrobial peptide transport system permease subunit